MKRSIVYTFVVGLLLMFTSFGCGCDNDGVLALGDDSASVLPYGSVNIDVTANDELAEDVYEVHITDDPEYGKVEVLEDGTVTYTNLNSDTDSDSFSYEVISEVEVLGVASVVVTIVHTETPITGCTDSSAMNFNASASEDDGSCTFTLIEGCTDSSATNYNPSASEEDGSCSYAPIEGCTDSSATNYNASASEDDGSCTFASTGSIVSTCAGVDHGTNTSDLIVCVLTENVSSDTSVQISNTTINQTQNTVIQNSSACSTFGISSYGNYSGSINVGDDLSTSWSYTVTSAEKSCGY